MERLHLNRWRSGVTHSRMGLRNPAATGMMVVFVVVSLLGRCSFAERGDLVGCFEERHDFNGTLTMGSVDECLRECEESFNRYAVMRESACYCTSTLRTQELAASGCDLPCRGNQSRICGGQNAQSYYDTDMRMPGPPTDFQIVGNTTDRTINLAWTKPETFALVQKYVIKTRVVHTYAENEPLTPTWSIQSDKTEFSLENLHPGTEYVVTLIAVGDADTEGGNATLQGATLIGIPEPAPKDPKIINKSNTTISIEIERTVNENGPVSWYRVVVLVVNDTLLQPFNEENVKSYNQSVEDGVPYYIAAEIKVVNYTRSLAVGDSRVYNGYYNAPLSQDKHVHILIGIVSIVDGYQTVRYSENSHEQHEIVQFGFPPMAEGSNGTIIALQITGIVIFVLLLVGSVLYYWYLVKTLGANSRRRYERQELRVQGPTIEAENNGFIPDEYENGNFKTQLNSIISRLDADQKLPRNSLQLDIQNVLATGRFGEVISGNLQQNSHTQPCQAHVISDDMERQDEILFLRGFDNLATLTPHKNILDFYGICMTADWLYVLCEDQRPTLKQRLIDSRLPTNMGSTRVSALSEELLLKILCDISATMEYLASNSFVHRQLCSYNIKLASQNQVKLSIFGPVPHEEAENREIDVSRWHAPEVLKFHNHTSAGDVWSFGCLIWECCCLGATLYPTVPSVALLSNLKHGMRPEQPLFVYDDLYQLCLNCWEMDHRERPTFSEVSATLRHLIAAPRHALTYDRIEGGPPLPYFLPLLEMKH